jgi:hypothetical protein
VSFPHPSLAADPSVVAISAGPYVLFAPVGRPVAPDQVTAQAKYLDEHPERAFQNWLGVAGDSGVPDDARYRLAGELIAVLYRRGVAPPPSVMVRREVLEREMPGAAVAAYASRPLTDLQLLLSSCLSYPMLAPEYVQIGPVDACNARCLFCVHHSPLVDHQAGHSSKSMLSWDVWKRCLDDLIAMKAPRVDYVGIGEPLMHPRIADALAYGSAHLTQNMISNGLLLHRHVRAIADMSTG